MTASLEGKSSSREFALEIRASAAGVRAHPASGCQKTRMQNSQAVAGVEDGGGGHQLSQRRPCLGIFPWIWESSRKGGLGLAIRAVRRQMAAGSRVPSPGGGAGHGLCHGLDSFLWLGVLSCRRKREKSERKRMLRLVLPRCSCSWSRWRGWKCQPGGWTTYLPPTSSIKLLCGQRGKALLQPSRRFPLHVMGWLVALPVLPNNLHGPGSSLV